MGFAPWCGGGRAVISGAQIVMTTLTLPSIPTLTASLNWCVESKWPSRYAYLTVFLKDGKSFKQKIFLGMTKFNNVKQNLFPVKINST